MNQETISLRDAIRDADAIVVGAGAGLSTAAGLTYAGERFERHFADFIGKYGFIGCAALLAVVAVMVIAAVRDR
jgi:NAD-dependent SIR2 family protein deacetylase